MVPYPVSTVVRLTMKTDSDHIRSWETMVRCVRTPAFVNWPDVLDPGRLDAVVSVLDWYPTLTRLAGATIDRSSALEGQDVWPLLSGQAKPSPRTLYWKTGQGAAVRRGEWKLVVDHRSSQTELFDLSQDPNERENLAFKAPERLKQMLMLLAEQSALDP